MKIKNKIIRFYLFIYFGRAAWHVRSWFPDQGLNPRPLQWKHRVLTTRLPGESQNNKILKRKSKEDKRGS